ncbi:MAG: acetyl-CoA carboxylase biotin carboxyl carrier protein [Polyangiales bacterium]
MTAELRLGATGVLWVPAPGVGWWQAAVRPGAWVGPGSVLGRLWVLGQAAALRLPEDAPLGQVQAAASAARVAVGYGDCLLELATVTAQAAAGAVTATGAGLGAQSAAGEGHAPGRVDTATSEPGAMVFAAPMMGRFYWRARPDAAPFVQVGSVLSEGDAVGLIEVMKTFTRVRFVGAGLPPQGRVVALLVDDGQDVAEGAGLFRFDAEI